MPSLQSRPWVPPISENLVQQIAAKTADASVETVSQRLGELIRNNQQIHERECFNLNPATNVMNPRAEAALSARLGSQPD